MGPTAMLALLYDIHGNLPALQACSQTRASAAPIATSSRTWPECLEDCVLQEFQWSRSMMNVLLGINGGYWTGLSLRAKLRLGFCQVWYPLFGTLMLLSVVLPLAAVLKRTPLMQVRLGDFYRSRDAGDPGAARDRPVAAVA